MTSVYTGYCIGLLEYCCNTLGIEVPDNYKQYITYEEEDYVRDNGRVLSA